MKLSRGFVAMTTPIIIFAVSKLIFNTEGDATQLATGNLALYLNAIASAVIILISLLARKNPIDLKINKFSALILIYYIYGAASTIYSPTPTITLYWSFVGMGYYGVSLLISESIIEKSKTDLDKINLFKKYILVFSIYSIFINGVFVYLYMPVQSILAGIPSDYVALLLMLYGYVNLKINNGIRSKLEMILIVVGGLFLNSFSSYLSFVLAILLSQLRVGRKIIFIPMLLTLMYSFYLGYMYVSANVGATLIFSKSAEAFLTGSGRFLLYETALNIYTNEFDFFNTFFGVGFMAERTVLVDRDLPWITDPHNSLILTTLGLGVFGFAIYLGFIILGIKTTTKGKLGDIWFVFHVAFLAYGITSSYYLGRPSFLLIFAIALNKIQSKMGVDNK